MLHNALRAEPEYNSKAASVGTDGTPHSVIQQLKQQLQDLESELVAAHALLAEISSITSETGRAPVFVYYTEQKQEIDTLQTERNRLYFLLENDHD